MIFIVLMLGLAVLIQLYYIVFVFSRLLFHKNAPIQNNQLPPVSVVVCAHNELPNLVELLPILNAQDYPTFDITILDDRSNDGSFEYLCNEGARFDKMRFFRFEKEHDHVTPKKYALTAGIRQAKHNVILLTDADCRPTSNQWIRQMAEKLSNTKQIVLGFSPYEKQSDLLNLFIRLETFYVALQYLALALSGRAYMGVGRNLMYQKSLFISNKGFFPHLKVMGGDDDLFINQVATTNNTAICIEPTAFVKTFPKKTWAEWFTQKERHLSVGKHYEPKNRQMLGLLSGSHVAVWFLLWVTLVVGAYTKNHYFILITMGLFGLRLISQWVVLALANNKLGKTISWYTIPLMDFLLFVYYVSMSVILWKNRNQKIRWK